MRAGEVVYTPYQAVHRERGGVLIVSLLILVVMMVLGASAMQSTTLQEKMAGNMKDRNLAFRAAETTLRGAELVVENLVTAASFGTTQGYYDGAAGEPLDLYTASSWTIGTAGNAVAYDSGIGGIKTSYMLTKVSELKDQRRALNIGGYGQSTGIGEVTVVKVTAHGVGPSGTSQVVLRTHYGKVF